MHVGLRLPTLQSPRNSPTNSPTHGPPVPLPPADLPSCLAPAAVAGLVVAGLVGAVGTAAVLLVRRVVVSGRSMEPTLVSGDRLLVVRLPRWWPLPSGSVVAVPDPRDPRRLLVKRATPLGSDAVVLLGDNPSESTDSRELGPVGRGSVVGVAWYRYGPPERAGLLRRHGG